MSEAGPTVPKCVSIAEAGITNSQQAIRYLSALIADGSAGRVTPGSMHANCNAVGKMLRVVEMEARFGTALGSGPEKVLEFLAPNGKPPQLELAQRALAKLSLEERRVLGLPA